MQEHTNPAANTVTDPTWAYVCLAIVMVLGAMTLFVLADSVIRVLIRRAQQRRELERWLADVEDGLPVNRAADRAVNEVSR